VVSLVHSRRSLTCGYENTALQAEKKILLNSFSINMLSLKGQENELFRKIKNEVDA
jgi:hypothetical protein